MSSQADELRRRLLELKESHPLPPELAGQVPRKDVWGETGYLNQPRYHSVIKPMLLRGYATVGFVYSHHLSRDGGDHSVTAEYAWLDERGVLRTDVLHEEFDAFHAALSSGRGDIVFSVDAGLAPGKVITLLHHPEKDMHMIYEALGADPHWEEKRERTYRVFHLRWEDSGRAVGSREPEDPLHFVLMKHRESDGDSWLLLSDLRALHTVTERPLAEGGRVCLFDLKGALAARVEAEGSRLRLTTGPETIFFITQEPGNMWMVRDGTHNERVMTILPDTPGEGVWQCVPREPMERPLAELFMLAFCSAYDGPAPFPGARVPSVPSPPGSGEP